MTPYSIYPIRIAKLVPQIVRIYAWVYYQLWPNHSPFNNCACGWEEPYGFVPEADCKKHDK